MYTDNRDENYLLGWVGDSNPDALLADGFNEAIIGMCERFGMFPVVAYDKDKCINILVQRDNMSYEEAIEYFDFNVIGAYMGEGTPVFVTFPPTTNNRESYYG